ncbi:hypothetical protein J4210_06565 [Candidatus Woesearchaeota archaeon]|nr:hypothetical protein [Candidatus Woesearchaeota archaeon]
MKKWFVPKSHGWGLVPISWEGWLVTLIFISLILVSGNLNHLFQPELMSRNDFVNYLLDFILLIVAFIYFSLRRTEGKVRWNWGKRR